MNEEQEALVVKAQQGDTVAFGALYDKLVSPVYRYVLYRVGGDDAEDLTEMIFLKLWENINQYKPQNRSFNAWVFRIAHNVVIDHYRSYRPTDELPETIPDRKPQADPERRLKDRLNKELLAEAMKKLKDDYRQILLLKFIEDLTNEEICFVTGRSAAAVRILQFRALRALKGVLEEMGVHEFEE